MHIDLFPTSSSLLCLAALSVPQAPVVDQPLYEVKERTAIASYWKTPGRYSVTVAPDTTGDGPYQVRLTPEGSKWFHTYQKKISGGGKVMPTRDLKPALDGPLGEWERWVSAKLAYDRYQATTQALASNGKTKYGANIQPVSNTVSSSTVSLAPPVPGPMPESLRVAVGEAPNFAESCLPRQYTVKFDTQDEVFTYTDHVKLRDRYAYYRFPQGVVSYGVRLSQMAPKELDGLFRDAGFNPSEQRIFTAVSGLEGGFETVQTYDTGYVSIGFIQFVTLEEGKADLSNALLQMKLDAPKEFSSDFHRFGIDVRDDRTLVVVDPESGAELIGKNAVLRIIDDKRLTAVFQRAGRKSPFRVAQIKVARSYYWPSADPVTVVLADGRTVTGTVGQVVQSEAGMATLLDRKINTGNLSSLPGVIQSVVTRHGCRSLEEARRYEGEIVAGMTYRQNFLASTTLQQPLAPEAFLPLPTILPTPDGISPATPTLPTASPSPTPAATPTSAPSPKPAGRNPFQVFGL